MIDIVVESSYKGYSRFSVIAMCGGFDASAEQLYVTSAQMEEGGNKLQLAAQPADSIKLIVYFIPRLIPGGKNALIVDQPPFEAQITVTNCGVEFYSEPHTINAWGGSAINLELKTKI